MGHQTLAQLFNIFSIADNSAKNHLEIKKAQIKNLNISLNNQKIKCKILTNSKTRYARCFAV